MSEIVTKRSATHGYATAVTCVILATTLSLALRSIVDFSPFPLFLAAVTISAWRGGMGPALLTTLVSVAVMDFLLVAPTFTFTVHYAQDVVNLVVFAMVALLISSLNARLLAARERALTAQAEAEEARVRSDALASERVAILSQIADGVILTDRVGHVTLVNEAAQSLLGQASPVTDSHELDASIFLHADGSPLQPNELPIVRAFVEHQTIVASDLLIARPDGSTRDVEAVATPVFSVDRVHIGTVMMLHDRTVQKDLERQKDEFLASVSHDLRTPLTAITHSIDVILVNEPIHTPEPLHSLFETIQLAAERMAGLIDDILELTRLRAGKVNLRLNELDVGKLLERTSRAFYPIASSRKQRVELQLPEDPVMAQLDGQRLERALFNLLSNAHLYGREGGTISLTLLTTEDDVIIQVTDDGPGIAETERGRVFERFYRSRAAEASRQPGNGLGLPIARALVALHGGSLDLDDQSIPGAHFTITLPRSNCEERADL